MTGKNTIKFTVPNDEEQNMRSILQTVYDALNRGQQKKIVKDEAVKALFDLYGVSYEE